VLRGVDGAEDVLKVAGAGAQDDPVRLYGVTLAGQGDVGKMFVLPNSPTLDLSCFYRYELIFSMRIGSHHTGTGKSVLNPD